MNKVFEPGVIEIDIQSDPNRVIEIQEKVKLLLEANRQRQEGIRQELLDEGAWALPGLINSTYVWMNRLEGGQAIRILISNLMADLAKGNKAAENLLVKVGVLENPFEIPRSIAISALEKLAWKPDEETLKQIKIEIGRQKKLENYNSVFDLYKILLYSGNEKELAGALNECKHWATKNLDSAGKLLHILTNSYPSHVEKILTDICLAIKKDYNDKNIARMLVDPLRPIPTDWLSKKILVRVSEKVLKECTPPRHTMIEFLWTGAVQDCKHQSSELWARQIDKTGEEIQEICRKLSDDTAENLYRYWLEALAKAGEIQSIINAAFSDVEDWGLAAAIQMCFGERDRNPQVKAAYAQALEEIKVMHNWRYQNAREMYSEISSKKKQESEIKRLSKAGTLRKKDS
jgi:hypothetical protein